MSESTDLVNRLFARYKELELEHSSNSGCYLIVNGVPASEFKAKWDELMNTHNGNNAIVWSKIVMLFDCDIVPVKQDIK